MSRSSPRLLLPHEGAALMVREILRLDEDEIECLGAVPADSPFVKDGRAEAHVALEFAAQASALLEAVGLRDRTGGPDRLGPGYLARVRDLSLADRGIAAGSPLRAVARREGAAPPLRMYRIEVSDGSGPLLTGSISTHVIVPDAPGSSRSK